jgi:hypothetical protein
LFQEMVLQLAAGHATSRSSTLSSAPGFYRIALDRGLSRTCASALRRPAPPTAEALAVAQVSGNGFDAEDRAPLYQAIARLSPTRLLFCRLRRLAHEEVADILGITQPMRVKMHRVIENPAPFSPSRRPMMEPDDLRRQWQQSTPANAPALLDAKG